MHGGIGASLVGLVAGYWVLDRAQANKANLKRIGNIIGWLVIVASLVSAITGSYCRATGKMCPFTGKGMMDDDRSGQAPMTSPDARRK